MEIPSSGLLYQSPVLEGLRRLAPQPFNADNLSALHRHVYDSAQRELTKFGMPPFSEIKPTFLNQKAFIDKFQEISSVSPKGIDFSTYQSFSVYEVRNAKACWLQFYNIDALQRTRTKDPTGSVFLHEITATIPFKPFLDNIKENKGPNIELLKMDRVSTEMSHISEGYANYFSQTPFDIAFCLNIELAASLILHNQLPAEGKIERLINDRHFFGALALSKIELAYGRIGLVDLLCKIPEPVADPGGESSYAYALWKRYKFASTVMASKGQIPDFLVLPFEAFGFDLKDGSDLVPRQY